ncbi:threonine synthase [Fusibacter ferrireducens]|uniref:Pyridoxal-phosphate dependent enzyme n=1 Tax=Fusibacter ferrireducens TaxID=2785058 RepID=A0ABR9ZW18_9FIRM|nr:pyridoxal-phosphate dependent enzyme [Fusibacter ferrireducens]MBF4694659.1 pyridoxal-phosphate dependent enzyme [Fusibacter ferrireducens]
MYTINPNIESLYCIKCGKTYPLADYYLGCPQCFHKGENAALSFNYNSLEHNPSTSKGIQKYSETLPYTSLPTLGEGNTPVVKHEALATQLGLKAVYLKNEFQNPTGSHKDRMSPLVIARALELGKKGVVVASSGNAGFSIAAYAANSGLQCTVISPRTISNIYRTAIESTGANLVILDAEQDTTQGRWAYMQNLVETQDLYPATNYILPPVGSNCFGVQGYKTIAYEIFEDFGDSIPEFIFVPVSRGDLLWGIFEGFKEIHQLGYIKVLPKLICVEPFERVTQVLKGADYRSRFQGNYALTGSIGGNTVTYQALKAVQESGGDAIATSQDDVIASVKAFSEAGVYLETSSAVTINALKLAISTHKLDKNSRVLMIATSNGFKNDPSIMR